MAKTLPLSSMASPVLPMKRSPSEEDKGPDVSSKLADFRKLEAATRAVSESAKTARADQQILDQLYFNGIQARHHTIESAHSKTFQWVFEELDAGMRLRDWLENRDGVFWVYGKPGSGKSTFMKFLCGHSDMPKYLKSWAGQKKLVVAKSSFGLPVLHCKSPKRGFCVPCYSKSSVNAPSLRRL